MSERTPDEGRFTTDSGLNIMADLTGVVEQKLLSRRNPLWVLLNFRWRSVLNYASGISDESRLKVTVVSTLGLCFWVGLFLLFYFGLRFFNESLALEAVRNQLIQRVMSLFFLALAFMLVFSNAVISFSSLFRAQETAFLFSLPLKHDTIFLYKLFESLIFSSWAVFAIGVPGLLAYGINMKAEWYFYPLVFVLMLPFVILPAAMGSLLGLLLTAIVPRQRGAILGMLALALLSIAIYVALTILNVQRNSSQPEMEANVRLVLDHLSFTRQPMTPNFWMTEGVLALGSGLATISGGVPNYMHVGIFFSALTTSALFFLVLGWFISGVIYQRTYSFASSGDSMRRINRPGLVDFFFKPLLNRFPDTMILLVKDVKTFMRDPTQWSQVLIFFGILTLYIGNLRRLHYPLDQPFYQNLIAFLNLGATCMTLATMTSRFIFPLISLEGQRFWVLGLVPISRRNIMMSKFYYALGGSLVLTITLVILSNYILQTPERVFWIQVITAAFLSLGLSGLSVGMGALFPSFHERNPSKIVSGFGGTLTLILAICLVVFSIVGEALICHRFLLLMSDPVQMTNWQPVDTGDNQFRIIFVLLIVGVALLNILAAYIPMKFGIRALERVEF